MEIKLHLPDAGQLSVITAGILICYAFLPFVQVPAREIEFIIIGILINFRLNFYNLISIITAIMAAAGMEWLLSNHPNFQRQNSLPHLILPALTASVIGFPLGLLEISAAWWIILGLGSLLVVLILVSEYISLDAGDIRYPLALMVLSGTSYSLLLILTIAIRSAGLRLFQNLLLIPAIFGFFSLRILNFRLGGSWKLEWSAVITLVVTQFLIGLFYWPLSPVRFSLLLLGPAYAMIGIASSLEEKPDIKGVFLEPIVVMGLLWLLAVFIP